MSNFTDFNLDEKLLKVLEELEYKVPTSIQALAIPKVLEGEDLIASAQTGSGKTAAFLLPSMHLMTANPREKAVGPRMLILVPTRELAMQIATVAEKYSKYLSPMKTVCIYGGVPYPVQQRALSRRYDILVATPGRLLDHMEQRRIDLSKLEILVLDEADRMLDMGFIDAVEHVAACSPKNRQTLLFSATLDDKILRLSKKLQNSPSEIRLELDRSTKSTIEQYLYYVDNMSHKMRLLERLLENKEVTQAIIFTSTKRGADSIAEQLQEQGHHSDVLHGDMSQRQRTRTIQKLRQGYIDLLVATDVAARGIDIPTLSHVINLDLPFQTEDYVHRIGRTGRAGAKGTAITFATYKEESKIFQINKLMGNPMSVQVMEGCEPKVKEKSNKQGNRDNPRSDRRRPPPRRENSSGKRFGSAPSYVGGKRFYKDTQEDAPRSERSPRTTEKSFDNRSHDNRSDLERPKSRTERPRAESYSAKARPSSGKDFANYTSFSERKNKKASNFKKKPAKQQIAHFPPKGKKKKESF